MTRMLVVTDEELCSAWHHHGAREAAELLMLREHSMPATWTREQCRAATLARLAEWSTHGHVRDGVRGYLR
jgi:hypothetical protein